MDEFMKKADSFEADEKKKKMNNILISSFRRLWMSL